MSSNHRLTQRESNALILRYITAIKGVYQSGNTTEHSYRPALCDLLSDILQSYSVINEERRIACGAPDLTISKNGAPVFFLEAKDIGESYLSGESNINQFNRYTSALNAVVFSDYLCFNLYLQGHLVKEVKIAQESDRGIEPIKANFSDFLELIKLLKMLEPGKITSASQLASLMAAQARLLKEATYQYLNAQREHSEIPFSETSLRALYNDFKSTLNPKLGLEDFSDIYAQTLTYGLFTARLHDPSQNNFTREKAMCLIPSSNPFLKRLFISISADLEEEIVWIVDELVALFASTDVSKIMHAYNQDNMRNDPIIHFYEDFLSKYDSGTRKERGVWYTPLPIVRFIVKAVDLILEKNFGLQDGLANNEHTDVKISEHLGNSNSRESIINIPRVQILDPATGTGTFLAECVRQIYSKFEGNDGQWPHYVKNELIQRLNGFELLMAPYAMAHLKLDLILKETGCCNENSQRFNIFLTDSLKTDFVFPDGGFYVNALQNEANAAENVKKNYPVMVVIGNPPYNGESENKDTFIMGLMQDYKLEPGTGKKLAERNPKWLNDDYVKFIRLAENYIERSGSGIVAFINPHGFLDNLTFRGMRYHLLKTFNEIYILDLHGSTRKRENLSDDLKDENVFNIMQGVSINIFVKKPNDNSDCQLFHANYFGPRAAKFNYLISNDFSTVEYQKLQPAPPYYYFTPRDIRGEEEYNLGFSVKDFFVHNSIGVVTSNDQTFVSNDERTFRNKITHNFDRTKIQKYAFRLFDDRFIYYDQQELERPRYEIMKHFLLGDNLGLVTCRQCKIDWAHVFCTDKMSDINFIANSGILGIGGIFPLYLFQMDPLGFKSKEPNFNKDIKELILAKLDFVPTPEEIFDYIYAVLHTPEYSEKYQEFLKTDYPRIPYPKNSIVFKKLVLFGERLRKVHLMKDNPPPLTERIASFPIRGNNVVNKLKYSSEKVYINEAQYFANVPEEIYNMYIGAYQPAQKYLKDRKGRTLSGEELKHYQRLVLALAKTSALMVGLSHLSDEWL